MAPFEYDDPTNDFHGANNTSPLHLACLDGDLSLAQYLVEELGMEPTAFTFDSHHWTALHCAASQGHEELCRYLLSTQVCRCDDRTDTGCTALELAKRNGHENVVQVLQQWPEKSMNSGPRRKKLLRTMVNISFAMMLIMFWSMLATNTPNVELISLAQLRG